MNTPASDDEMGEMTRPYEDILFLRGTEYAALDEEGHVYLDYTGANVPPRSLVGKHHQVLSSTVLGNPHSSNPSSQACTDLVERTRADVLRFFNASPAEYTCIFVTNATAALRLVGEAFPFGEGGQYALLADNHNSVNGISVFAARQGARVTCIPTGPNLRIDAEVFNGALSAVVGNDSAPKLLAFPAQSNFSGVKHSLEWVAKAQKKGWTVLLDAAAYVPTSLLDLSVVHPDFVSLSFYKMMGYPTGVGALIAKHSALNALRRPWFAGGTVEYVNVPRQKHILWKNHEGFEDGTLNFLSIPAVGEGLKYLRGIGMSRISEHVHALTVILLGKMKKLRHGNGAPLLRILGPQSSRDRGGTVAFEVLNPQGQMIRPRTIEGLANQRMISLRSGCFCNPGAAAMTFPIEWEASASMDGSTARKMLLEKSAAMRVSLGIASSLGDISAFINFLETLRDRDDMANPTSANDVTLK